MKKFLYLAAACLLAACNGGDEPEQQPSLEVKPLQLDFAAADAAPAGNHRNGRSVWSGSTYSPEALRSG